MIRTYPKCGRSLTCTERMLSIRTISGIAMRVSPAIIAALAAPVGQVRALRGAAINAGVEVRGPPA